MGSRAGLGRLRNPRRLHLKHRTQPVTETPTPQDKTRLVLETLLAVHDSVTDSPDAFSGYTGDEEDTVRVLQGLWELLRANPELTTPDELLEDWQDSLFDPELEYTPEESDAKLARAFAERKEGALLKLGDLQAKLGDPSQQRSWGAVGDLELVNQRLQELKEHLGLTD